MNATTFAPRNVRELKKLKSTIGSRMRGSSRRKAPMPTAATAKSPRIRTEPQPQELASTSARMSAVSPTESVPIPGQSTVCRVVSSRDSRAA
jgi:hypothetical protein